MSNMEIGKYGEKLAAEFLQKLGYKIIETNYKYSKCGEIDIIALDKKDLCFVEVKTRTQDKFGSPLEAITKDKLLKILSCTKAYKTDIKFKKTRIDAISVELSKNGEANIKHVKNIEI